MKIGKLLWAYSSGVRLVALLLMGISFVSLFTAVQAVAALRFAYSRYAFLSEAKLEDAFYFNSFGVGLGAMDDVEEEFEMALHGWNKILEELAAMPGVEFLGREDKLLNFMKDEDGEGKEYPIYLLSEGMLELFPTLGEKMTDTGPGKVYLVGNCYEGKKVGEDIRCYEEIYQAGENGEHGFSRTVRHRFTVAGRMDLPLFVPGVNQSGSVLSPDMFLDVLDSPCLLLPDTRENREALEERGSDILSSYGFFLRFREDASEEEKKAVEDFMMTYGFFAETGVVKTQLKEQLRGLFMALLPRSFFLLALTVTAYSSMILLTVRKKRKEMAVSYLCGGSGRKIAWLLTGMLFLVTLPPAAANLVCFFLAKKGYGGQMLSGNDLQIDGWSVATVLIYTAVMLLLTWVLSGGGRKRKSPIEGFREAAK